jgi:RNA polymerase-interacting CarD/CdnL/TRCF family regulator
VRDLAYLGRERKLAKQDQDLKSAAQHLIATEIAVHLNLDLDAAAARVEDLLKTAIGAETDAI